MRVLLRLTFITLFTPLVLFAYTDTDLDGVDNEHDKCPNTPFMDLVDENGCSVQSLSKLNDQSEYFIVFNDKMRKLEKS